MSRASQEFALLWLMSFDARQQFFFQRSPEPREPLNFCLATIEGLDGLAEPLNLYESSLTSAAGSRLAVSLRRVFAIQGGQDFVMVNYGVGGQSIQNFVYSGDAGCKAWPVLPKSQSISF
jgi:hypothetical protein